MPARTATLATVVACLAVLGLLQAPSVAQDPGGAKGDGTEDRQWVDGAQDPPDSMSPAQYEVALASAPVPLRDGTALTAQLYLPARAPTEEPGPCVVTTNGYAPPSAIGALVHGFITHPTLDDLAQRGYAGAHVFLRGAGVPADEALYYKFAEDGYDIVEWMADQPWCDGNVGMTGLSLLGISQWLTAQETPPSLKAIIPEIGCGECYWHLWYKGGMLPGEGRQGRTPPDTAYDEYAAASQHRDFDGWWQERDQTAEDYEAIAGAGIAVLQCGGWDDYLFAGGVRGVEQVVAAGGSGMQVIGPCAHGNEDPSQVDPLVPYEFATLRVLWFDRYLKGIDNGIDEGPGALILVEGPDQYRFEDEWPIPDAHTTQLYLRAEESGSATSLNDGSLSAVSPRSDDPQVSYDYSPDGPYNDAGAAGARPTEDQRDDEEHSLTWTTPPLTTPTEVTGWPALRLFASSTASDTDFVVELTDVAPDGTSTQVGRGWLNAPRHFDRTNPEPLESGRVYEFDVELWPMSYVFQEGHRIRVALSGSDNPGTAPNPEPATVTVHQDAAQPSSLELPVIGTSWQALEEVSGESGSDGSVASGTDTAALPATGSGELPQAAAALTIAAIVLLRRHTHATPRGSHKKTG